MKLIPLFVAAAAAMVLFMSAPLEPWLGFRTTDDYIRRCSTQEPSEMCRQGFQSAAVKLASENDQRLCDPSSRISDLAKGKVAWDREIPRLVDWLSRHPQPGNQSYLESLGVAMAAVYPCK